MKAIKLILWGLGILVVGYLILCLIGPSTMDASATTVIHAPAEKVFSEVSDFQHHKVWSPWHKMDPEIVNTVSGEPGAVGHKDVWVSKKMGDGSQEIVEVVPNSSVKIALRFKDYDEQPSWVYFHLKPLVDSTEVTWSLDGGDYPFMMRGMAWMMDMNKIFADGLLQLKNTCEKQ